MLKEFKEFALKGNMIDLAVGVIIGGAFNSLVTSLVDNIIMPVISIFTGKIDFSNLFLSLDGKEYDTLAQAQKAGAATLNYGTFITGLLNLFENFIENDKILSKEEKEELFKLEQKINELRKKSK